MSKVPRDAFVPEHLQHEAESDRPLPIGFGQTISQPYIVAWMTQELRVTAGVRVLEIGTGSGYQAAILAELGAEVFSVEIVPELAARARQTLASLGYARVHIRVGSGYDGWADEAPFDRIVLTASPPEIPPVLIDQLADGGRLVGPVGVHSQVLVLIERHGDRVTRRETMPVLFVPMV
jgi:protein-L-isoaspartate(D-aspartate) O-methyltransferase